MVGFGQVCLLSKQIAGFFDQQYLWKESVDILDDFHGDIHEGKVACEFTIYGWLKPGLLLVQSKSRILWSSISLEGINLYLYLIIAILSFFSFILLHLLWNLAGVHLVMTCFIIYLSQSFSQVRIDRILVLARKQIQFFSNWGFQANLGLEFSVLSEVLNTGFFWFLFEYCNKYKKTT